MVIVCNNIVRQSGKTDLKIGRLKCLNWGIMRILSAQKRKVVRKTRKLIIASTNTIINTFGLSVSKRISKDVRVKSFMLDKSFSKA